MIYFRLKFKLQLASSSRRAAMTHTAALLAVIFPLVIQTAAQVSVSCIWTKSLPGGEVHRIFLLGNPRQPSPSLRLYHSSWSGQRALLGCAWSDDSAVLQNYVALCRERTHQFSQHPDDNVNFTSLFESEGLCASLASLGGDAGGERAGKRPSRSVNGHSPDRTPPETHRGNDERSEGRSLQRVKRGFIVPGTLWCGSGNRAPSYQDLGVFAETDKCCREHDQCKYTILSFHSQFGVFNSNIFTMSHCDCDNKFQSCLKRAQDSISDVVGYTFFNLLKMRCFEFSHRLQCTERNWFGMCKETKMSLYAEVQPPRLYDSPDPGEVNGTGSIINATTETELLWSSTSQPQLLSITAAGYTLPPLSTSSPSITPAVHVSTPTAPNAPEGASAPERRNNGETIVSQLHSNLAATQLSCAVYKDLDNCKTKILPQQRGYGLHNTKATTLYHCTCTTRLFQTLANQRQLSEVQALLLGHVAPSCFVSHDCTTAGMNCTAELRKAPLPELEQWSGADVEKQRHLQAVRGANTRAAKRKNRAVRLHRLCLRMVRAKLNRSRPRVQGAK